MELIASKNIAVTIDSEVKGKITAQANQGDLDAVKQLIEIQQQERYVELIAGMDDDETPM